MKIRDYLQKEELSIQAGGQGSGCQGPNCGRKVSSTPDHTGKIPVPADIAKAGADIANRLNDASNRMDGASRTHFSLQYNKSGARRTGSKAMKEINDARKAYDVATKKYQDVRNEAENFEKTHGLSTVNAWEAHNNRDWPNYKVSTSGKGRQHYVPKE